jgi:hypothetical protein
MALLFMDSFNHYDTNDMGLKWDSRVSSPVISSGTGRFGDDSLRCQSVGRYLIKDITASDTLIVGFAFLSRNGTYPSNDFDIFAFDQITTQTCEIFLGLNGSVGFRDANNIEHVSLPARWQKDNWQYLEAKIVIHDTNGSFEIRLNGSTVLSKSNIDTSSGGMQANRVRFGGVSGTTLDTDFSDFYLLNDIGTTNNDFLGDTRVEVLFPNGAGTTTDWAVTGAASNFQAVDESPPDDDTSYVSDSTLSNKDTYNFDSLNATSGTISAVQVNLHARKDDVAPRGIVAVARSVATETDGTEIDLTTSYDNYQEVYETDPNGGGSWTVSSVNAAEFGVKIST